MSNVRRFAISLTAVALLAPMGQLVGQGADPGAGQAESVAAVTRGVLEANHGFADALLFHTNYGTPRKWPQHPQASPDTLGIPTALSSATCALVLLPQSP